MLAKKLIVLACFLCAGSALATELDETVKDAMNDEGSTFVTDKVVTTTEPLAGIESTASGGEESRPSGEENKDG